MKKRLIPSKKQKSIFENIEELIRKPESTMENFTKRSTMLPSVPNFQIFPDQQCRHHISNADMMSLRNELKKMDQEEINTMYRNNFSLLNVYPVLQGILQMSCLTYEIKS